MSVANESVIILLVVTLHLTMISVLNDSQPASLVYLEGYNHRQTESFHHEVPFLRLILIQIKSWKAHPVLYQIYHITDFGCLFHMEWIIFSVPELNSDWYRINICFGEAILRRCKIFKARTGFYDDPKSASNPDSWSVCHNQYGESPF